MTQAELIVLCREQIARSAQHGVEPGVQLFLKGERRGRRARLMPGVSAEVLLTEDGPDGPRTLVRADPRAILRALGSDPARTPRQKRTRVPTGLRALNSSTWRATFAGFLQGLTSSPTRRRSCRGARDAGSARVAPS